jgi:hypothetical protein
MRAPREKKFFVALQQRCEKATSKQAREFYTPLLLPFWWWFWE